MNWCLAKYEISHISLFIQHNGKTLRSPLRKHVRKLLKRKKKCFKHFHSPEKYYVPSYWPLRALHNRYVVAWGNFFVPTGFS